MSAIDWDRVRALFQDAADRPANERGPYLLAECAGDEALRREVESLLAAHNRAEGFLEGGRPGGEAPATGGGFAPGSRLGAFEILGLIGAGGMGEVYRARDTRLGRDVALKTLPASLAAQPTRLARLRKEARILAALSHPHIATLFGLEESDGTAALVMELVEGRTLADRLQLHPSGVREALELARQIASGLEAAHDKGVLHRDLKPANIVIDSKGQAKLLDFGLAMSPSDDEGTSHDSTASAIAERAGAVVGTLPYMSPEQVRGEAVDERTDIWAFGCVLYEMLTGRRVFPGASWAEVTAAILDREPDWAALPESTSPGVRRLLARCLQKNRERRLRDIGDARLELEDAGEWTARTGALPQSRAPRIPAWIAYAAIGVLVAAAAILLFRRQDDAVTAVNARPVIVLMDSPGRVYDPATAAAGGTNADDVSDALTDLPVVVYKENTSSMWHREEHILRQNPDLIISHLSCLLDARQGNTDQALEEHLLVLAESRLILFFGYIGTTNPRTRFLVYSRSHFATKELTTAWMSGAVARFPTLQGRVYLMPMPGGRAGATFRDPATARMLRDQVKAILTLQ